MSYNARKFSQKSYNENDKLVKDIFIDFIKSKGHEVIVSSENYSYDIITKKDNKLYFYELEAKELEFTCANDFRYTTVSFCGRKKRLENTGAFFYIVYSKHTGYAAGCWSNIIYNEKYAETIEVSTTDRSGTDKMYRVPKDKCLFFKMKI